MLNTRRLLLMCCCVVGFGCAQPVAPEAATEGISLSTATSFHEKLSHVMRENNLFLKYRGGLADDWTTGLARPFTDYGRWSVYSYRTAESGEELGGAVPWDHIKEMLRQRFIIETRLCDLYLRDAVDRANTVTVRVGAVAFGVEIEPRSKAGQATTALVRSLLQSVGQSSSLDPVFGIRARK